MKSSYNWHVKICELLWLFLGKNRTQLPIFLWCTMLSHGKYLQFTFIPRVLCIAVNDPDHQDQDHNKITTRSQQDHNKIKITTRSQQDHNKITRSRSQDQDHNKITTRSQEVVRNTSFSGGIAMKYQFNQFNQKITSRSHQDQARSVNDQTTE